VTYHPPALSPGTTIVLVRHGETESNVRQVWYGALDAPLTARGRRQVQVTAQRLAELHAQQPVEHFYVSPLPRAKSTAAAIEAAIGLQAEVEPGLREFSIGDWEGRTYKQLREIDKLWERWNADPAFAPPNGESPLAFSTRVAQVLEELAAKHSGASILAVSHGAVIATLLGKWLGSGPQDWRLFDPHNCAISLLEWDARRWQGRLVNDISHLPRDAVVLAAPEY
jgi:broad specificity phosphatase PhoE